MVIKIKSQWIQLFLMKHVEIVSCVCEKNGKTTKVATKKQGTWWFIGIGGYLIFRKRPIFLLPGWWFGTSFIFPDIGKNHPNWLIFSRGVQTNHQPVYVAVSQVSLISAPGCCVHQALKNAPPFSLFCNIQVRKKRVWLKHRKSAHT